MKHIQRKGNETLILDFRNKRNIEPWKVKTKKLKGAVVVYTDSFSIVTQVSRNIRKRLLLTLCAVTLYFYYYAFSRSYKALLSWIDSNYRSLKGSLLFGIRINQLCPHQLKLLSSCYGNKKGNEHSCKRGSSVSIQLGLMVRSCRNSFMFWDGICSWMENTKSKNGGRIRKNFYSDSVAFGERFHHS